jgi:death-on-curing protein
MTKNHAVVDGNKRLTWLRTVVFCDLYGVTPRLVGDEAFQLVWDIADSDLGIDQIAERRVLTNESEDSTTPRARRAAHQSAVTGTCLTGDSK